MVLIQRPRIDLVCGQGCDHEPRVRSFVEVFGFADHATATPPTLAGPVLEVFEKAGRLASGLVLLLGLLQLTSHRRDQTSIPGQAQDEIDLMNEIKEKGVELGKLIDSIEVFNAQTGNHGIDMRWVSIGKTHLQQGLMALTRSVAKPEFF